MSGEQEGHKKNCWKCKTPIIYVKVESEWNGQKSTKLQWQNQADGNFHYSYINEKEYHCHPPVEQPDPKPEPPKEAKPEEKNTIKVTGPFDEAELIARWASERAYKIVMADVSDFSKLTQQEKSGLGQKEGMLTRLLADTVIELMKQHDIKTEYAK